jgi:response regulator RpfG family c-di-GMP phosphodiesterase
MKIIILDDSLTIRMIIESFLKDFDVENDEIFSFDNGHKAIDFIKENGADVVLSDIYMPMMDGSEFAKLTFEIIPSLKNSFFCISSDESPEILAKMKKIGVHRFLKKPINQLHFKHFIIPEIIKCRSKED